MSAPAKARALDVTSAYVDAAPDGRAVLHAGGEAFWAAMATGGVALNGWLVSGYTFDSDWTTWEKHPKGDEVVIVTSGRAVFVLERQKGPDAATDDAATDEVELTAGQMIVVPADHWHTLRVLEGPVVCVHVTAGEGTTVRPA